MRPHDYLFLPELLLKAMPNIAPPSLVQLIRHDLVDDQIVPYDCPVLFLPQPMCRGAGVGGESAETLNQFIAHLSEQCMRNGRAVIVVKGEEDLDEIHGIGKSCFPD